MANSNLLVLRFRDIEREINGTINEHNGCISAHNSVWWGWLKRPYEKVPLTFFGELEQQLAESSIAIALYDTGQGKIYQANCISIQYYDYLQTTPDPVSTPAYYNSKLTNAWFKFDSITETEAGFLLGRYCISMPSATDDCAIDLEGSQVVRLSELRRQEVTMWVLSPTIST
jgi:hypothetical protein